MPDTFSLPALRSDLDELYRLLAELLESDLVLDGLEERGLSRPLMTRQTIILGVTEPFEVDYGEPSTSAFDNPTQQPGGMALGVFGLVLEAKRQAAAFRTAAQSSIETLLEPLVRVAPGEFRGVAEVLVMLYLDLRGAMLDDFAGLRNEGGDWEGEAADAFFDNFYEPLAKIRANHLWAIDYLTCLTAHLKGVSDLGQQSLANLATCALEVARAQLHERHERNRGPSASETLAYLTAIAGVVSVVIFPVAPAAGVALGSISYMLGYAASEARGPEAKPTTTQASSARELHATLFEQVYRLTGAVDASYGETADGVRTMRDTVAEMDAGSLRVSLWLPGIPDLRAGSEFFHETSGRGLR
ncbi:hypothetical protein BH09ACT12_BH09ACT12_31480 [soil metagenome]